jgi:hypothetical protein
MSERVCVHYMHAYLNKMIAEAADGLGPDQVWAWVQAFVAEVKALTGNPCLMYTGYYFWKDHVGNPSDNLGCPLWYLFFCRFFSNVRNRSHSYHVPIASPPKDKP